MSFFNVKTIDKVWAKICKYEGETFYTVSRKKPYTYVIVDGYILINNDKRRKVTKSALEKAISINNPTPTALKRENIWAPSYICGIITDSRIK